MRTHNVLLYHCLICGNLVHRETAARPPQCCDHEMVMAAAETIYDREEADAEKQNGVHCEIAESAVKPR